MEHKNQFTNNINSKKETFKLFNSINFNNKMEEIENKLNFTSKDVKKTPENITAVIVAINIVKAIDIYGKDKVKDKDQELIKISLQNANYDLNDDEYIPYYSKEKITDNSKLGKFLLKYDLLEVSMTVGLVKKDDGFYKLNL